MKETALAATEIRIQYRSGLYAAYAAMTGFFFLVLVLLPRDLRPRGFELIVLLDPAFMGYFFAGGLVLLERDQGMLAVIVTHGGGFRSWWRAKTLAVMTLAMTAVTVLTVAAHATGLIEMTGRGLAFLVAGLALSIPLFFSFGVVLASRFTRILDYFVYSGIVMIPFMIPLVEIAGFSPGPLGWLSPVQGGMVLLTSMFGPIRPVPELAGAVASLLVWNGAAYVLAQRAFTRLAAGTSRGARESRHRIRGAYRSRAVWRHGAGDVVLLLRDPMTRLILAAPLAMALVLGRGLPALLDRFPQALILASMDQIRSFMIILAAVMYGMLGAFLVLDEKDEGILPVLQTMPGPPGWYILRRGMTLVILFGVLMIVLVPAGDLIHGPLPVFLMSLAVDAMTVIAVFLAMSILARNKVQGLAMAKVLNIVSLPPLLAIALPERAIPLVGLFPTAWGSLMRLHHGDTMPMAALFGGTGMLYMGLIVAFLYRRVSRGMVST